MEKEVLSALIQSIGTLSGAIIIGIAGGLISKKYSQERDSQDKESQWRSHAIELTKLDLKRKLENKSNDNPLRPNILDFLANYRDLKELDHKTPGEVYKIILEKRIKKHRKSNKSKLDDGNNLKTY